MGKTKLPPALKSKLKGLLDSFSANLDKLEELVRLYESLDAEFRAARYSLEANIPPRHFRQFTRIKLRITRGNLIDRTISESPWGIGVDELLEKFSLDALVSERFIRKLGELAETYPSVSFETAVVEIDLQKTMRMADKSLVGYPYDQDRHIARDVDEAMKIFNEPVSRDSTLLEQATERAYSARPATPAIGGAQHKNHPSVPDASVVDNDDTNYSADPMTEAMNMTISPFTGTKRSASEGTVS